MSSPTSWEVPTHNVEEILIGRCHENRALKPKFHLDPNVTCEKFVTDFINIWDGPASRNANISTSDYDELLSYADFSTPRDKSIFWAGVPKPIVSDYTNLGSRFTQLVETPGGSLINDLSFCATDYYDANYKLCFKRGGLPQWNSGFNGAAAAWWQGASREFAKAVLGHTHVFLYGSSQYKTAFYDETIFAKVEIPNLNHTNIDKLTILFAKEIGFENTETCDSEGSSIKDLTDSLINRGFKENQIECIDDPWEIEMLLCINEANEDDPTCEMYRSLDVLLDDRQEILNEKQAWVTSAILGWCMFSVTCLILISLLLIKRRRSASETMRPSSFSAVGTTNTERDGNENPQGDLENFADASSQDETNNTGTTARSLLTGNV